MRVIAVLLVLLIAACTEPKSPDEVTAVNQQVNKEETLSRFAAEPCENNEGAITVYCGFSNPEDMVLMPDGSALLISEMGEFMTDAPGQLVLFDLGTEMRAELPVNFESPAQQAGEAGCEAPDPGLFSPHGIDLLTMADGRHRLLVVNHGGREAVEFFELNHDTGHWQATWQGCALPPGDPFINDVAALNDGGFLVTHMWDKHQAFEAVAEKLINGENTGWVWRWHQESGFQVMPATEELMPNGIAVSADNHFAFVNIYMGNRNIKVDLVSGEKVGEFEVRQPDNVTRDSEGNLLVASHHQDPINENCAGVEGVACLLPFEIVSADADTLETSVVLTHSGEPMGYVTVALRVGDRVFLGSAHGDRIASIPAQ